jgi:hypothetical protein
MATWYRVQVCRNRSPGCRKTTENQEIGTGKTGPVAAYSGKFGAEHLDLFPHRGLSGHVLGDSLDGIQDRGVVAIVHAADIGQGIFGILAGEVHGHLTRKGDRTLAGAGTEVVDTDLELAADEITDGFSGNFRGATTDEFA